MIPFEPESNDELKKRFPLAIEKVYGVMAVHFNNVKRPGENREHVFDFTDGLRVIVSKDKMPGKYPHIHFSSSPHRDTELRKYLQVLINKEGVQASMNYFKTLTELRIGDVFGYQNLVFLGFSDKGVPHFMVELK